METDTQRTGAEDRIQKRTLLRASRSRVWRAIADSKEFGTWFGMKLDARFSPGARLTGTITPTSVDPEVANQQREYEGMSFEITVDRVEPERLLSFRWHPYVDRSVDYSDEPRTVVAFELEERPDGVMLTLTESGFNQLSPERRAKAFAANEQGWTQQMKLIEKYLTPS